MCGPHYSNKTNSNAPKYVQGNEEFDKEKVLKIVK